MRITGSITRSVIAASLTVIVSIAAGSTTRAGSPQGEEMKRITIEANARGTSTQLGRTVGVTIIINEFSTADDQAALLQAFKAKGSQGLANALGKMHAKGRIAIPGTLGYDLNYIRQFQTPTGTRIRFVTDRPIRMAENWADSRSSQYNLSAGEIDKDFSITYYCFSFFETTSNSLRKIGFK